MHYLTCLNKINDFSTAKEILTNKGLKVKEYGNKMPELYIVKYDKSTCNMTDPDVTKCRGLVLSKNDNRVVCAVPPKSVFDNEFLSDFNTNYSNYNIQDFIDGTMINFFSFEGQTYISTRSCLNAKCRWFGKQTFADMFYQCLGERCEQLDSLDMSYCYSFVIQHPNNTIVKKYQVPDLVLTTVSKINEDNSVTFLNTHEFIEEHNLEFRVPTQYNFNCIEDMYGYINSLGDTDQGVVILKNTSDGTHIRTKIRNSKYTAVRMIRGNTNNKMYLFFQLRQQGGGAYENYLTFFEEDKPLFDEMRQRLYNFTQRLFQNYLDCFVNKTTNGKPVRSHKTIDYELKPLVAELHSQYYTTRQKTTKNTVIQYLHNLPIPRLLFALNFKPEENTTTESNSTDSVE
jgi:hypothetical protein